MSVAFRRDSDEEHLEPRFELPLPTGPNLMTAAGPALVAAHIARLERAIAAGDAPEPLQRELRYWKTRAATAQVAPMPAGGIAGIGSRVRFRLNDAERVLTIVGHDEASRWAGRTSDDGSEHVAFAAPLARALMGTEAGDLADFQGRADAIEILHVENG